MGQTGHDGDYSLDEDSAFPARDLFIIDYQICCKKVTAAFFLQQAMLNMIDQHPSASLKPIRG
jgi:hypothetical protein